MSSPVINFDAKNARLSKVFRFFDKWLASQGLPGVCTDGGESKEPQTYTYRFQGYSLCSLQFRGKGNDEFVRFRFEKEQLARHGIHEKVLQVFKGTHCPGIEYKELPTEECLDFGGFSQKICQRVCDELATIFREKGISG